MFRGYFRSDDIRAEVTKKVFETQLMTGLKQQRWLNQVAGKVQVNVNMSGCNSLKQHTRLGAWESKSKTAVWGQQL